MLFVLLVAFMLFSLFGCVFIGGERYTCEAYNVEAIEIIQLGELNEDKNEYDYTVLREIEDISTFVNRLNELKQRERYWGAAYFLADYVVIKIDYPNGDYDMLHHTAQLFYRDGVYTYEGFIFDMEQFNSLVSD